MLYNISIFFFSKQVVMCYNFGILRFNKFEELLDTKTYAVVRPEQASPADSATEYSLMGKH